VISGQFFGDFMGIANMMKFSSKESRTGHQANLLTFLIRIVHFLKILNNLNNYILKHLLVYFLPFGINFNINN